MAATGTTFRAKEQPMFPTTYPDIVGQLAIERAASLRADAQRYRLSRRLRARWRPARSIEPAADLSRVAPPPAEAEAEAKAGRAG
jgi:hypothetical protein